jgi:uncharacterized membrane protein
MRKTVASILICLFINLTGFNSANASPKYDENARLTKKIKAGVVKLGTGENAHVEIELHDETILKGYVKETDADSFVVADAKNGAVRIVHYPQVKKLKGYNLSTGQKVAVGFGVSLGILFLIWVLISTSD